MKRMIAVLVLGFLLLPAATHAAFDTDLRYGSSGAPVLELQEFLTAQGVYTGPISGNFYALTLAGVKSLQAKLNVTPQSGYFGPLTRAEANNLLSADLKESDTEASSTPVVIVPKHKTPTPTPTAPIATGGPTVTTPTNTFSLGASAEIVDGVIHLRLDQTVDEAHVFMDNGVDKPMGFAYASATNDLEIGWTAPKGTYTWTIDAIKKDQKGSVNGTVMVQ